MEIRIPEQNKKSGVCYAADDDGIELPVIDVTHPAFACEMTEAQISAVIDDTIKSVQEAAKSSPEVVRAIAEQSRLVRGTIASAGTFMTGMMTYLHRLGPDNLGSGFNAIDRRHVSSILSLSFRFRLRDMARQLATALGTGLESRPDEPVDLFNIAGGPAMDSINGLLLLQKEKPGLLSGRTIRILVLDIDTAGPHFGARALQALCARGAPLHGVDVTLEHLPYNWTQPDALRAIVTARVAGAPRIASTEGGLFDYGDDASIVANLIALREVTPRDFKVVGSVVRDVESIDPRLRAMEKSNRRPVVRYLGRQVFATLAREAGWKLASVLDSTAHHVVTLEKA